MFAWINRLFNRKQKTVPEKRTQWSRSVDRAEDEVVKLRRQNRDDVKRKFIPQASTSTVQTSTVASTSSDDGFTTGLLVGVIADHIFSAEPSNQPSSQIDDSKIESGNGGDFGGGGATGSWDAGNSSSSPSSSSSDYSPSSSSSDYSPSSGSD